MRWQTNTLLERFELTTSMKYFYGAAGSVVDYHLFLIRLGYFLPHSESFVFSVGYQNGRAEDTLQQIERWDFNFGVRF
jgi:hypothetical protein